MTGALERLRAALARIAAEAPGAEDTLGLIPAADLKPSGYEATPANCRPFAWTGGDGVHFSLMDVGEGYGDRSPVVMTVPMNFDAPSLVLGRDLSEFLALGLSSGYFVLEQLSYDGEGMLADLASGARAAGLSDDDRAALAILREAFGLRPWADLRGRFGALQAEYGPLMAAT